MNLPLELQKAVSQPWPQSSHEIVSKTGYLLGVDKKFFYAEEDNTDRALYIEIFKQLEYNKPAKILRNLCIIRNSIELNFKNINNVMRENIFFLESFSEYIPLESIQYLASQGVRIPTCKRAVDYIIELNRIIQDRVNNCKGLFPAWLEWDYLRNLFIMPDGLTEAGTKVASDQYYPNKNLYPYGCYMNWRPHDEGNILYNDSKFLQLLYSWNRDDFTYTGHVSVLTRSTKENIYNFLDESQRTVIVVDCENADPYRFHAVLDYLGPNLLISVEKILLFNDHKTTVAWNYIGKKLDIPVQQIITERVLNHKSLVDIRLAAETSKEFYKNNIDSFILVSSDSDYFGLISALPEAHFLVVMEREHCSNNMKEVLKEQNITHCFMDDFPLEEGDELKEQIILREVKSTLMKDFNYNLDKVLETVSTDIRAELSPAALKDIRTKIIKNIRIEVDEDGEMKIELNRLK